MPWQHGLPTISQSLSAWPLLSMLQQTPGDLRICRSAYLLVQDDRLAAMEAHQAELLQSLHAQGKAVKALQQSLADAAKREKRLEAALEAQVGVGQHAPAGDSAPLQQTGFPSCTGRL